MDTQIKPATPLPWIVGEYDECLGYDCMTGGVRAGPVVIDAGNYGQESCVTTDAETMSKVMAEANYIVHACNAYPKLVAALNSVENFLAGVDGMSLNNIHNMAAEELTAIRELLTATPPHE